MFLNLPIWLTVRTLLGSPFQWWGPATEKARSPACFLARGTSNVMAKSERRLYLVLWTRDWKYEDKYPGELKWKALKAWTMSLKRILFSIGSQWRDCRRGKAWVRLGYFRISRAHLFWRTWRRLRCFFGKKYTSGPRYWNVAVLVNTGTFLVYQYCLKMWYLCPLERAGVIQKLTILERKNGLVLANTRVPVSGTWSILFLFLFLFFFLSMPSSLD